METGVSGGDVSGKGGGGELMLGVQSVDPPPEQSVGWAHHWRKGNLFPLFMLHHSCPTGLHSRDSIAADIGALYVVSKLMNGLSMVPNH